MENRFIRTDLQFLEGFVCGSGSNPELVGRAIHRIDNIRRNLKVLEAIADQYGPEPCEKCGNYECKCDELEAANIRRMQTGKRPLTPRTE